jgi:hypothetical protein
VTTALPRAFLALLAALAALISPATCGADTIAGMWSATERTRGGLAAQWVFAPNGVATRTNGALVDYRYAIQGARLSLTELDENHAPTSKVTTQDFTLLGDALTMNPTKPEGRQLMKRAGQPFPGAHPIVGEWSFRHFSGGIAYMRFGRAGIVQLSIPFETAVGTWAVDGPMLTTRLKDGKPTTGPWRIEKGYLHFRDESGREARYRRFEY